MRPSPSYFHVVCRKIESHTCEPNSLAIHVSHRIACDPLGEEKIVQIRSRPCLCTKVKQRSANAIRLECDKFTRETAHEVARDGRKNKRNSFLSSVRISRVHKRHLRAGKLKRASSAYLNVRTERSPPARTKLLLSPEGNIIKRL